MCQHDRKKSLLELAMYRDCWRLLGIVGNCWKLLEIVEICLNSKTTAPRQDVDAELQVLGIFDLEYQFKRTCGHHGTTVP